MFVSPPSAQFLSKLLRAYPQCLPCKVSTPCIISRRRANKHSPAINPSFPTSFQRLSQQRGKLCPVAGRSERGLPKLLYCTFARSVLPCISMRSLSNVETSFDLFHVEIPVQTITDSSRGVSLAERRAWRASYWRVDFILVDDFRTRHFSLYRV